MRLCECVASPLSRVELWHLLVQRGGLGAASSLSLGRAVQGDSHSRLGTKLVSVSDARQPSTFRCGTDRHSGRNGAWAGAPNCPVLQRARFRAPEEAGSLRTKGRVESSPAGDSPVPRQTRRGPRGVSVTLRTPAGPAGSSAWPESDAPPPARPAATTEPRLVSPGCGGCPPTAPRDAFRTRKQRSWAESGGGSARGQEAPLRRPVWEVGAVRREGSGVAWLRSPRPALQPWGHSPTRVPLSPP